MFFTHILPNGRHRGKAATLNAVADSYTFPQMRLLVIAYIKSCTCCFHLGNSEVGNRELHDSELAVSVNIPSPVTTKSQTIVSASVLSVCDLPLQNAPVQRARSGQVPPGVMEGLMGVRSVPQGVFMTATRECQDTVNFCGDQP